MASTQPEADSGLRSQFSKLAVVAEAPPDEVLASAPASLPELRALDRSMLSSIAWTGAAKWIVQAISWISTIVLVRLLSPVDYGIVGMAGSFLALLQPLCDFGIGAAVVQGRHLTREQIARLNSFSLVLGLAGTLVTAAAAFPLAVFYREPALRAALPVIGLGFICTALRVVPTGLLTRDMRFRRLAAIESIEALCLLATTLGMALNGFGYWSLVAGPLVAKLVGSALAVQARPTAFRLPLPLSQISGTLKFGAWVAVSALAWFAYAGADQVIIGRVMGEAALGAYSVALSLAAMPIEKITQLYQRVAGSVISRVQHDPRAVGRYLLGISEGVSLVSFPLSIGLALVADLFVPEVLGARWQDSIGPLQLLALAATIRSLDPLLGQILVTTGHARQNARSMMIGALLIPGAFLAGAQWGLTGVAAVWLTAYPAIVMSRQLRLTLRSADTRLRDYARALWPAASSTAIMAIVVTGVRTVLHDVVSPATLLIVIVAAGAVAYVVALATLHPHRIQVAWAFVRRRAV